MIFDKKYSRCEQNQPIVTSEEKGNAHVLNNKSRSNVYQFLIDGDIVSIRDGERCDFYSGSRGSGFS